MYAQTRKQMIQKIHIAKKQLNLDEQAYKLLLMHAVDKPSCAMMSDSELMVVLKTMEAKGFKAKSNKYGKRPTASQSAPRRQQLMSKIEALLAEGKRSWHYAHAIGKKAFGIDRLQWLTDDQLHKMVQMLAVNAHRHGRKTK